MKLLKLFLIVIMSISIAACQKDNTDPSNINEGNDPNFKIVAHSDSGLSKSNRKVVVFGIDIYAAPNVEDAKLLHAANIMAQYLDNNEDDIIDNQAILDKMIENKAFLFLWKKQNDFPNNPPNDRKGQDLGNDETVPAWHTNGQSGRFDASLEEVFHIITHAGYSEVYPQVFGENQGSSLANAMDIARGGQFTSIPNSYPANAWYTYDDSTCNYSCMATEYFYWAMTSILGAQSNRLEEIQQEWKLNTKDKVQSQDEAVYELLIDPQYGFPTTLPDGTYKR